MSEEKDIKIAADAMHALVAKLVDNNTTAKEKMGKMFSPELSKAIVGMFSTPLLAMFDATVGEGKIQASMVASFVQGLFMGCEIGTQNQPLAYCDDIVHKYCTDRGVDFKEAIEATFGEVE